MATTPDLDLRRSGYNAPTQEEAVELVKHIVISNFNLCRLLDITQGQLGTTFKSIREILRQDSPWAHSTGRLAKWWEVKPDIAWDNMAAVLTDVKEACPEIAKIHSDTHQSWTADDGQVQPHLTSALYNRFVQRIVRGQMGTISKFQKLRTKEGDATYGVRPQVKRTSSGEAPGQPKAKQKGNRFGIKPLRTTPMYLVKHDARDQWWDLVNDTQGREAGLHDAVDTVTMWKLVASENRALASHEDYNRSQLKYDLLVVQCTAAWPGEEHRLSFQATKDSEVLFIDDQASLLGALSKMQELQEESDQDYVIFVETIVPRPVESPRATAESAWSVMLDQKVSSARTI